VLGLPLENVSIKLGDSSLPRSPVEGGSWVAASVSNGIATTANAIRDELLRLAKKTSNSPLANLAAGEVTLADGKLMSKGDASRSAPIADVMRQSGMDRIEEERTTDPSNDIARAHNTHAAVFAEVKIDEQLGIVRVTRVVSAIAAGRILNAKTASSQILGGVVWGIGMALHEETMIDEKLGRIMNANIAEYYVPVNADIHDIKVIFVDEADDGNPLGVKGVGEIGIVGVAAAIANAVCHATGRRVRDLPITLDKLL
jgi:xanthine dehydrogenase YagR molybdenum-binding subunit